MVVVADTSPVNYLVLIGHIEILPRLYNRVLIPTALLDELQHPLAPSLFGTGPGTRLPGWRF